MVSNIADYKYRRKLLESHLFIVAATLFKAHIRVNAVPLAQMLISDQRSIITSFSQYFAKLPDANRMQRYYGLVFGTMVAGQLGGPSAALAGEVLFSDHHRYCPQWNSDIQKNWGLVLPANEVALIFFAYFAVNTAVDLLHNFLKNSVEQFLKAPKTKSSPNLYWLIKTSVLLWSALQVLVVALLLGWTFIMKNVQISLQRSNTFRFLCDFLLLLANATEGAIATLYERQPSSMTVHDVAFIFERALKRSVGAAAAGPLTLVATACLPFLQGQTFFEAAVHGALETALGNAAAGMTPNLCRADLSSFFFNLNQVS